MEKIKELCGIHHFMYDVTKGCPFCRDERLNRLTNKYLKKEVVDEKPIKPISMTDIEKLKQNFNSK